MTTTIKVRRNSSLTDLNNPQRPRKPSDDIEKINSGETGTSSQLNAETQDDTTRGDLDYSGAHEKTDPREIALVKKLDFRIMPIMWAMYFLNFLDRNAIANARMNHLERDLALVGSQYVSDSLYT
jgi:hypothetical protein